MKTNKPLYFLCFSLLLVLSACSRDKTEHHILKKSESLVLNPDGLKSVAEFSYFTKSDTEYIAYSNRNTKALTVVNLVSQKSSSIPYPKDSFLDMSDIVGINVATPDSIFILTDNNIILINSTGNLLFSKGINRIINDKSPERIFGNFVQTFTIHFDRRTQKLYAGQYCGICKEDDPAFYSIPVASAFNLKNGQFEDCNVYYPPIFKNYYGDCNYVFCEPTDSCDIISFMATPDMQSVNRYSGEVKQIKGDPSSLQHTVIQPLDTAYLDDINKKVEHMALSPIYMRLLYDKYRHVYYRFFLKEQSLRNADGTFNSFGDKQASVMVLDTNFHFLSETDLKTNYLTFHAFVGKEGLYILQRLGHTNKVKNHEKALTLQYDIFTF